MEDARCPPRLAHPVSMVELALKIDSHWPHNAYFREGTTPWMSSQLDAVKLALREEMADKKRLLADVEKMRVKRSRMTVELDSDGRPTQLSFTDSAASSSGRN